LKLNFDEPLSNFAFKSNLRRYTEALKMQEKQLQQNAVGPRTLQLDPG
jgi:hypothetical protein